MLYIIIIMITIIILYIIWYTRNRNSAITGKEISTLYTENSGRINRQHAEDIGRKRFGAFGNVSRNGCSAIAIYNANRILGMNTSFEEILGGFNCRVMKWPSPVIAGGLLGGSPLYVRRYYQRRGYTARWMSRNNVTKDADAYIVLGFYAVGAHYQAGEYESGGFHLYNPEQRFHDIGRMSKVNGNFFTKVLEIRKNDVNAFDTR